MNPVPASTPDDLVPPRELLFDGTTSQNEFVTVGDNFVANYLVARARLKETDKVLDVGCGIGQKARPLTTYLRGGGAYEGFDVVAAGIEWCKERYRSYPDFHFQHVDLYSSHYNAAAGPRSRDFRFPYPNDTFDLVLLSSVFTHMLPEDVPNYLAESARVLKRGGRYVVTYFLLNPESTRFIEAGSNSIRVPFQYSPVCRIAAQDNPEQTVAYDEGFIRGLYLREGLHIAEVTYGHWSGRKDILNALQDVIIAVKV